MKKITVFTMLFACILSMHASVIGFVPQGKKMPNGQMNPKTIININDRVDLIQFITTGKIPAGVLYDHVYYKPWWTDQKIRQQYADLLRTKLIAKTKTPWEILEKMLQDSTQTPIRTLLPGDTVYSNGVGIVQGKREIVPAPVRLARVTANGQMEQYIELPNNVRLYLTCLNIDIHDEVISHKGGEESLPEPKEVISSYQKKVVYVYDTVHTVVHKYNTKIIDTIVHNKINYNNIYHEQGKQQQQTVPIFESCTINHYPQYREEVLIFDGCTTTSQKELLFFDNEDMFFIEKQPQNYHYKKMWW